MDVENKKQNDCEQNDFPQADLDWKRPFPPPSFVMIRTVLQIREGYLSSSVRGCVINYASRIDSLFDFNSQLIENDRLD